MLGTQHTLFLLQGIRTIRVTLNRTSSDGQKPRQCLPGRLATARTRGMAKKSIQARRSWPSASEAPTPTEREAATTAATNQPLPPGILVTAPPPWHTSALIAGLLANLSFWVPHMASVDEIATAQTLLHVNFPDLLSVTHVALLRLLLGAVMVGDTLYAFFYGSWKQDTDYYQPYSQLKVVRGIPFRGAWRPGGSLGSGLLTLSSFTMWAWVLEGLTFLLTGGLPLYLQWAGAAAPPPPQWLYRVALVGWEISAPTSLLVSVVDKYVLWPMALAQEGENNAKLLKHPGALLEHNWNVLACLLEVAVLGGLPLRVVDVAWAPLFGLVYVLFSYAYMHAWAPPSAGPQFLYPFLDTTLGWRTTACLLALLAVLVLSFGAFFVLDVILLHVGGGIVGHLAAVGVMALAVCRFRD